MQVDASGCPAPDQHLPTSLRLRTRCCTRRPATTPRWYGSRPWCKPSRRLSGGRTCSGGQGRAGQGILFAFLHELVLLLAMGRWLPHVRLTLLPHPLRFANCSTRAHACRRARQLKAAAEQLQLLEAMLLPLERPLAQANQAAATTTAAGGGGRGAASTPGPGPPASFFSLMSAADWRAARCAVALRRMLVSYLTPQVRTLRDPADGS